MANEISALVGAGYEVCSLNTKGTGGEQQVEGRYYRKRVDVSVAKGGKCIAIVSVKFVTSNYKQNSNNYFEHLLGETANLRRTNVGVAHLLVMPKQLPYYKKDGSISHVEVLNDDNLAKYVKLIEDHDYPHKPDIICFLVADLDVEKKEIVGLAATHGLPLSEETKSTLSNELSLANFLEKIKHLIQFKG